MIKKYALLLFTSLCCLNFVFGQLSAGDIAFIQYNFDSPDNFAFVALADIPNGEVIHFTDNGWMSSGAFRSNEGIDSWTSPGVNCGDIIVLNTSLGLAVSGDQILAYQGSASSPTFIAALHSNNSTWDADAVDSNTSALPTGLTDGVNAVAISEMDNGKYDSFLLNGTIADVRLAINNASNWTTSNSTQQTFTDAFTLTDCGGSSCTTSSPGGSISGTTPSCNDTDLTHSGSVPPTDVTFYWQTSASGTDMTFDSANTLNVNASGDFYVRAYNSATMCWSSAAVGPYSVVINSSPTIDTQPVTLIVNTSDNAVFSASITGATSFQWEESVDGVSWTNVGTSTTSYTVSNAQTNQSGNYYRITATNSCGDTTSDIVRLYVFDSTCIDEDFVSYPSWTNGGTQSHSNPLHYGNDAPCREVGTGDGMISPSVNYPEFLIFYQDASNGGNGNTATIDYQIGAGAWTTLYSFQVTTAGNTEVVNLSNISGVDLSQETNVRFRFNSTFNTWYLDDVKVYCTPCTPPSTTTTILPDSGPIGTYVTISGSDFSGSSTVTLNELDISSSIISQTATEIVVQIPSGATDGNIVVTTPLICDSSIPFDVIDQENSCQSSLDPPPSDLIIYELFDEDQDANGPPINYGNGGMITIFNGTLETKNLSEYRIYRSSNYNTQPYGLWFSPTGTLAPGELFRIRITSSQCTQYTSPYEDVVIGFNADDGIELRKDDGSGTFTTIDQVLTPSYFGYYYQRSLPVDPNPVYDSSEWTITDIYNPPGNTTTCTTVGVTPTFIGGVPTLSQSNPGSVCNTATITISDIEEGYNGTSPPDTNQINVVWYYNDGTNNIWNVISSGGDFTISTTIDDAAGNGGVSQLIIDNVINKVDYQFYCEVQEDDNTCYQASEAIKLDITRVNWDGNNWNWSDGTPQNTPPDNSSIVIIDGNYDTSVGGIQDSFEACNLIINAGNQVIVRDGDYIRVVNDVVVNGISSDDSPNPFYELTVETQGAFVQLGDDTNAGTFTLGSDAYARVLKTTATFDSSVSEYNYTYWSTPVHDPNNVNYSLETIETIYPNPVGSRRYYFMAQNFIDDTAETGNNNATVDGQDDIDDDGNDWQNASGALEVGRGYAVTAVPGPPPPGGSYSDSATFIGEFNTGDYLINVYKNNAETLDNNWNFIGNPYPGAIDAQAFLTENTTLISSNPAAPLNGAIFLWSHGEAANAGVNGNENLNFNQDDYAIINGMMGTAGGSGVIPDPYIPAGQGFFVAYEHSSAELDVTAGVGRNEVRFTNSMRSTGYNSQFFNPTELVNDPRQSYNNEALNKLWLDLISDNGVFSQIGIAYADHASNDYDGWYFDAPRNLSTNGYSNLYSTISNQNKQFVIQTRNTQSLNIDEKVNLGFFTKIEIATLYSISINKLQGNFFTQNDIYIRDNYLNIIHNLKDSDYTFTSDVGDFKDRFEIVFALDPLSDGDFETEDNSIIIIELPNGNILFKSNGTSLMNRIEIYDLLGRSIYSLNAENSREKTFVLPNLSQSTYLAKIHLDNGLIVTKKAIKRK